jgi:hypothetical protein
MKLHENIWYEVFRFLGDGSVASFGSACWRLYFIARRELKLRAKHYLESDDAWEHGFYPERGYYGIRADYDGDRSGSAKGLWWIRCVCEHHERLFLKQECSCKWLDKSMAERVLTTYRRGLPRETLRESVRA